MVTPYVQSHHGAELVLQVTVAVLVVGELVQGMRVRRRASRVHLLPEVTFRLAFFAGILMLPLALSVAPDAVIPGRTVPFAVGAAVAWSGLLLRWWSFVTLGRLFTNVVKTAPDQPVVSCGPYRFVRHPSYTGLLGAIVGIGLMLGNWAGALASLLLVLAALVHRIRIEERALIDALGDDYRRFARTRARLIPFAW